MGDTRAAAMPNRSLAEQCRFCGHANPGGAKYCNECGSPLSLRPCAFCGAINGLTASRCHACDAALHAPEDGVLSPNPVGNVLTELRGGREVASVADGVGDTAVGVREPATATVEPVEGARPRAPKRATWRAAAVLLLAAVAPVAYLGYTHLRAGEERGTDAAVTTTASDGPSGQAQEPVAPPVDEPGAREAGRSGTASTAAPASPAPAPARRADDPPSGDAPAPVAAGASIGGGDAARSALGVDGAAPSVPRAGAASPEGAPKVSAGAQPSGASGSTDRASGSSRAAGGKSSKKKSAASASGSKGSSGGKRKRQGGASRSKKSGKAASAAPPS